MRDDRRSIFSVDDWFETCPPKTRKAQWKDGYSAKEEAKAWFRSGQPRVPSELESLWRTSPQLERLAIATVHPELRTPLDEYKGDRSADAVLLGVADGRPVLVSIEAKAGEDFGPVIEPYLRSCVPGNIPNRIDWLSRAVFGRPVVTYDETLKDLRYQLLHALAGTVIEAKNRGADLAAMVIHYFPNSRRAEQESIADLQEFVSVVSKGAVSSVQPGQMFELELPGGGWVPAGSRVWVGWATAPVPAGTVTKLR